MLKQFILLLSISVFVHAEISLESLNAKPKSHSKDFMIWQYLNQNITPQQADTAYEQVNSTRNNKIFYRYAKKTKKQEVKEKYRCKRTKNLLSIRNTECLNLAYHPKKSLKYSKQQRKQLISRFKDKNIICMLNLQNERNLQKKYESYNRESFLEFFNKIGYRYRNKNLNINLNKKFVDSLSCSAGVSQFIKTIVNTKSLYNLQKSLLKADGKDLDSRSNFFLAMNHIEHHDAKRAMDFLELSENKALTRIDKDKSIFWQYLLSDDKKYLAELTKSTDINIYTLYAGEVLGVETKNYFFKMDTDNNKSSINLKNPFSWDKIHSKIKETKQSDLHKLAHKYRQINMLPAQAYIVQKASNYRMHAYLMPYDKYLQGSSNEDKALIYALMRQESQLIPSALSSSFALGLMQMMPFVTNAISKEIRKPIQNLNEMFEPKNNLRYAKHHLRWMKRSLYHPLFIAYAYNGGIGFFKRYLLNDNFNKGKYEPFLSMEMMSNTESREYGKKVLANYVMYKKILGEKVSIVDLLDNLMKPKKSDRFRVSK